MDLLVERREHIELWTLNRPAQRNALSLGLLTALRKEIDRVSADRSTRAVIIGGAAPAFCAGADLKERSTMNEEQVREVLQLLRETFRAFERSNTVFIAAINGAALGGGLELALSCDLRLMVEGAEIGLSEVSLGIIPGAGGTQRLPRLIGPGKAKELIFTARRVTAQEALSLGLINHIGGLPEAISIAQRIAHQAPSAVGLAKHAIDDGYGLPIDAALTLEQSLYQQTLSTDDRKEGLRAFAEKRAPRYAGK